MKEVFRSDYFPWIVGIAMIVFVGFMMVRNNLHWFPRDLTSKSLRLELQNRFKLGKQFWITIGAIVLIGLLIWGAQSMSIGGTTEWLKSLSITKIGLFGRDFFVAIAVVIIVMYLASMFLPDEWKKRSKALKVSAFWLAGLFAVSIGWSYFSGSSSIFGGTKIPLASQPQSEWPKLYVPANGPSEDILVPPDMRVVVKGRKFTLHNVYTNGDECTEDCPDAAAVAKVYITSKTGQAQNVIYAFSSK